MPISKPIIVQVAKGVYAVNEYGLDSVFVVEGSKSALVIDLGIGCCDLRSIIEDITNLPYEIVLTHGHLDHVGSWDQFERVYLHPDDWEKAKAVELEPRIASGERMRGLEGDADVWQYSAEQFRAWEHTPEILPLEDGMEFDLGDRVLHCVHTPGHSAGSCCLIDPVSRILFSGDSCNVSLRITDGFVEDALKGLLRLKTFEHEYDRNFNGHLAYASGVTHISMPLSTLDDCIRAMEDILADRAHPNVSFRSQWADKPMVASYICGAVTVTYNPEKLRREAVLCPFVHLL